MNYRVITNGVTYRIQYKTTRKKYFLFGETVLKWKVYKEKEAGDIFFGTPVDYDSESTANTWIRIFEEKRERKLAEKKNEWEVTDKYLAETSKIGELL